MSENKYSVANTRPLERHELYEYIRLRPQMYIGNINIKAFVELLKELFSSLLKESKSNSVSFEIKESNVAILRIENIQSPIIDNWSKRGENTYIKPLILEFHILNALSDLFKIELLNEDSKTIYTQEYAKGKFIKGNQNQNEILCSEMKIEFTIDKDIWGNDFNWNENFISQEIKEFAYLYKKVKFKFLYQFDNESCKVIYCFKNGLMDLLDIEKLKARDFGYSLYSYFDTFINKQSIDFYVETAFTFRDSSFNEPFLKSFVNDVYTCENGSHLDGLLQGLAKGVIKYLEKYNLTEVFEICQKRIEENVITVINVRMDTPIFKGSIKNKLENTEIVDPIANLVADVFFDKIKNDEVSIEKLKEFGIIKSIKKNS